MNCLSCNKSVNSNTLLLICCECNGNFHLDCITSLTKSDYDFIKSSGTKWKCFLCDKKKSKRSDDTPLTPTSEKSKFQLKSQSDNSDSDLSDKTGVKPKVLCGICNKGYSNNAFRAQCVSCKNTFHFKCLKMSKEDYEKVKQSWQCTVCSDIILSGKTLSGASVEGTGVSMLDLLSEMKQFRCDVQKTNKEYGTTLSTFRQEMLTKNQEFANSLNTFSEWVVENGKLIKELSDSVAKIVKDYEVVKQENINLRKANEVLTSKINFLEQSTRDKTVELYGIPFKKEECVIDIVDQVSTVIGFNFNESMVDTCYRIRQTNTDVSAGVVLRFVRKRDKEEFMELRRKKRNLNTRDLGFMEGNAVPVYVNDSLTKETRKLFNAAKLVKRDKKFTYLWVKNGRIFMRRNPGEKCVVIECQDDLNKLM